MSEAMTPEEATERLAFYCTFSDAVDQIRTACDVLAALVDPAAMLSAWERTGKLQRLSGADEAWDIGDRDAWCLSSQPKEKTGDRAGLSPSPGTER